MPSRCPPLPVIPRRWEVIHAVRALFSICPFPASSGVSPTVAAPLHLFSIHPGSVSHLRLRRCISIRHARCRPARALSTAFLWIPPQARQVRGVVMAGMTLMEREFAKDARIRQACADQQLAIGFLKCGLSAIEPQKVLDDLARVSGYRELSRAPLLFVGHSAGGPQAKAWADQAWRCRCFGLVQYRGGVPGGCESVPPGVPVLMMIGQFDEFGGTMRDAAGREALGRGPRRPGRVPGPGRRSPGEHRGRARGRATSPGPTAMRPTWRCSSARPLSGEFPSGRWTRARPCSATGRSSQRLAHRSDDQDGGPCPQPPMTNTRATRPGRRGTSTGSIARGHRRLPRRRVRQARPVHSLE